MANPNNPPNLNELLEKLLGGQVSPPPKLLTMEQIKARAADTFKVFTEEHAKRKVSGQSLPMDIVYGDMIDITLPLVIEQCNAAGFDYLKFAGSRRPLTKTEEDILTKTKIGAAINDICARFSEEVEKLLNENR